MQSVSSRIWTRVAMFISYDDNNYTMGTSMIITVIIIMGYWSWIPLTLSGHPYQFVIALGKSSVIYHMSHQHTNVAQGCFQGGPGHRAEAHICPTRPKIPPVPSALPPPGTPPKGAKVRKDPLPRGRRNSPVSRHKWQNCLEVQRPTECNPTTREERSQMP